MSDTVNTAPRSVRRVDSASATQLVRLVEAFEDIQTVLRCCERLIPMIADPRRSPDDIDVEALWTLAVLSYARGFSDAGEGEAALTPDDLVDAKGDGEVLRWHQVLLHLRDHHADPVTNPREVYTVGVAQDDSGAVNAVAVTSVRSPLVDEGAVRQAGAMAFPLCAVLNERIDALQKSILDEVRDIPKAELEAMDLIEVAT